MGGATIVISLHQQEAVGEGHTSIFATSNVI